MKKARFTESRIVAVLKEADARLPVGEVVRKHGISLASYYKWKPKYGGLEVSELKRIVADLTLENKAIKELITKKL